MTEHALNQLKYPIGKFSLPEIVTDAEIKNWISEIESLPSSVEIMVTNLSVKDLNLQYRPDGWMIKQVVHHLADSHMNAFIRFKLTLTEESPLVKPFEEDRWANLADGMDDNIEDSLNLLKSLHAKWTKLLRHLTNDDLKRSYIHPEHGKRFQLEEALGMYAWHCQHHLTHIRQALIHRGKFD